MRITPTFYRFRDLTTARANVDYQIHTSRTDGEAAPTEILAAARDRKLSAIAITEHVMNPYVSIGSDVHALKDLGGCRDSLIQLGMGAA